MKIRLLVLAVFAVSLLWVSVTAVRAAGETPAPYAGLKNPFPWGDASAQAAGKGVYQQSCAGCHGAKGDSLPAASFAVADFSQRLEANPDFYFWVLSEGRLSKGMPPYKSSLSEQQRWQVLTYLGSLSSSVSPPDGNQPSPTPAERAGTIQMSITPVQAQAGQPLTLSAFLRDMQSKPISDATVKFFVRLDFFVSGLMEVGEATTNQQGLATIEYIPRETGAIEVIARYNTTEDTVSLTVPETNQDFYHTEVGIRLPTLGPELFIGPQSAFVLEMGRAPMTALRLPGGLLSWLWLMIGAVMLIWFTYFRVVYQVFRIPVRSDITETNTRLIPLVGLVFVVIVGIILVLMIITGPNSNLNLSR
ncbi:MAG: Cytochrome c protein [Dehalococcoidales bacterium]|nr:Cytochrome c protein [Dehalococcoidales bacterium]